MITLDDTPQRALVLHPRPSTMPQYVADYGVEEAEGLTVALQAVVVGAIIVPLREIRASEYFGKGKVAEIKGKSSVFNILTEGGVLAKDMLFATLDTTHRIMPLPSGKPAVLSDTVGFIADLPTDLIKAFRATLEEVKEADLLVHVRDIADPLSEARAKDVTDVLALIEAGPQHGQAMIETMPFARGFTPMAMCAARIQKRTATASWKSACPKPMQVNLGPATQTLLLDMFPLNQNGSLIM